MRTAILVTLLAASLQTRIVPPPPPPPSPPVRVSGPIEQTGEGAIHGVVTQPANGAPVAGALITVTGPPGPNGAVPQLNVQTDSSGRFIFHNIPTGIYSVAARREDYWGPATASNTVGQRVSAAVVSIEPASKTANVTLSLTPGGTIQGMVRRPDGAVAVESEVCLLRINYRDGLRTLEKIRTARTDDRGQYRFVGLPPAEFYVRAEMMSASDALAYYPGVADAELAVPVRIRGGDEAITDIQMIPTPAFRVSGTVINAIPERAQAPIAFMLIPGDLSRLMERDPTRWLANQIPPAEDGRFEILVTTPGRYHLMPVAPSKPDPKQFSSADPKYYTGRISVDVRDRDVDGVNVTITRGSELTIRVSRADGAPIRTPLAFRLRPVDPHETILHSHLKSRIMPADGAVTFSNIPEGRYHLIPQGLGGLPFGAIASGLYIQNVLQSGQSISADGVIAIRGENAAPVEVVFAAGGGEVEVSVDGTAGKPDSGIQVSLVPQGLRRNNPTFYRRGVVTDGIARFSDVAPGEYKAFAWEDLPPGADENEGFMLRYDSQGRTVSVRSNITVTGIRLPLIAK